MTIRKFLTSVADVFAYDQNDNIVFVAKTLLDSSLEASLGSQPVRGGRGNQLQYVYYHTGELKATLTDTQWNLAMLGSTVGSDSAVGYSYYAEETIAMSGSAASVSTSPLAFSGTTVYGWATNPLGNTQKVTFTGKSFSVSGSVAGDWCVRYYTANETAGQGITIKANMIPQVLKIVMEAQLNSADVTTNKIGIVQIIIPKLVLSGAFTISMTADGISNTPLTGTALAFNDVASAGCVGAEGYYAKIVEIIDATNWYDNVSALAFEDTGSQITLAVNATYPITIWAVPLSGASFKVSTSLVSFTSASPTIASVGATTGIVVGKLAGTTVITAAVTSASALNKSLTVLVPA